MTNPTAGSNITKQTIVDVFNATVRNPQNDLIVWHRTSNPSANTGDNPNIPANDANYTYQYGGYSNSAMAQADYGPSSLSAMSTGDIPDTVVTWSTIINAFIAYGKVASRVRKQQTTKYYNYGNGGTSPYGAGYFYDQTRYTSFAADQATVSEPTGVNAKTDPVSASNITTVLNNIYSQATANRDTTVVYHEQWCHNNCHSNYGARGRR